MDKSIIEVRVRELQKEIYLKRDVLYPNGEPSLSKMFKPEAAMEVLGIKLDVQETLGRFGDRGEHFETAGMLNRHERLIAISARFPMQIMRFTAAHEIGHWVLHHELVMHRDRPIFEFGVETGVRPLKEKEADYFGACYLMPKLVVIDEFEKRFGSIEKFRLNDGVAYSLNPRNPHALLKASGDSLDVELALANCTRYVGGNFNSLSSEFFVSPKAMAIRLREMKLTG